MFKLFVDMDGVLADFDSHHEAIFGWRPDKHRDDVDWNLVQKFRNFYLSIPPMPDMLELWDGIKHLGPIVLTGIPSRNRVPEASDNKRAWARLQLGAQVPVLTVPSKEKFKYSTGPNSILIDDWEKYRKFWEATGGRWITHRSARETLTELEMMGVL